MATIAEEEQLELVMRIMNMKLNVDDLPDGNDDAHPAATEAESAVPAVPSCGTREEWAALLFDRMNSAADAGDAVARAAGLLEAFEGSVVEASHKERNVAVSQNGILKKAVLLLYRMFGVEKAENLELQRQVARCEKRVKQLEKDNYTLQVYLMQAQQQGKSMPGHFHPGVF